MSISYFKPEALNKLLESEIPLLDVRSPSEFKQGHIEGAISFPLFSDEERSEVGTIYKKISPEQALLRGLQIIGPKMHDMVVAAKKIIPLGNVGIYCWRGGKRSNSLAWLLDLAGFHVQLLSGGYKAFRQYANSLCSNDALQIIILGGRTGSAKTTILSHLKSKGQQVIDLEALANHKGSAFGWIGEQEQKVNEQFENNIFLELLKMDISKPIWIENESKNIGKNFIPESLWCKMKTSLIIHLDIDFETRLDHLIENYQLNNNEQLILSFNKIQKRIGPAETKKAMDYIHENKYREAATIALKYYDSCYDYSFNMPKHVPPVIFNLKSKTNEGIADDLIQFINSKEYGHKSN